MLYNSEQPKKCPLDSALSLVHIRGEMNKNTPFGWPQFDPSKMDPKVLMQLSQLIQQLPPEHLNRMQTLMHNSMAGYDVQKDMEEFEKNLPAGFREKLMAIVMGQEGSTGFIQEPAFSTSPSSTSNVRNLREVQSTPADTEISTSTPISDADMNLHEARITVLRAVAEGKLAPEEAEKLLFSTAS